MSPIEYIITVTFIYYACLAKLMLCGMKPRRKLVLMTHLGDSASLQGWSLITVNAPFKHMNFLLEILLFPDFLPLICRGWIDLSPVAANNNLLYSIVINTIFILCMHCLKGNTSHLEPQVHGCQTSVMIAYFNIWI